MQALHTATVVLTNRIRERRTIAILMAAILVAASAVCIFWSDASKGDSNDPSEEEVQLATDELYANLAEQYNSELAEYGITYSEYCEAIDSLFGKAISIISDGDSIKAEVIESVDKGKTMADSRLDGDVLHIYVDSVSLKIMTDGGKQAFGTLLGAAIGTALGPGYGTIIGGIAGFIAGEVLDYLYDVAISEEAQENGIWIDLTCRGHVKIFNHKIYYPLPPNMWKTKSGAQ